jgi:phosphate transport system substrate-binding protein
MEARDAERQPWKIDATPELSKLGIAQAEVDRWDGSLSLHPFILSIAVRCEGIDTKNLKPSVFDRGWTIVPKGSTLSNTHPGILAVIKGEKDVSFSTRRLSQAEIDEAKKLDVEIVQVPFAKDAFVFLQNRQNPVRNLTLEQYQSIFSGGYQKQQPRPPANVWYAIGGGLYQSWKDVGGFGGDIVPLTRNSESGSGELIQTLVMKGIEVHEEFKPKQLNLMGEVFVELENTTGSIAYSIYHYDRYMVFNADTRVMGVNGVFPNAETIASGKYPLVYECVLVHRKQPGEKVERFVKWLLSEEGQKLVRSVGYVPIK